jgi:enamine deaminase RidA (YjgF/YER057c/UK114 family)
MKIEIIKSGAPRPLANYNECFKVGPWVFAAGQIASDYKTGVAPEARRNPAFPYYGSDIKLQTHYVLGNLKKTFETAGSSLDHVVKAQVFMTDLGNFNAFDEVWRDYFKVPPARTTIGTSGLLVAGTLVEIDLVGHRPGQGSQRAAVTSSNPKPLANYTEAFRAGDLVFAAANVCLRLSRMKRVCFLMSEP